MWSPFKDRLWRLTWMWTSSVIIRQLSSSSLLITPDMLAVYTVKRRVRGCMTTARKRGREPEKTTPKGTGRTFFPKINFYWGTFTLRRWKKRQPGHERRDKSTTYSIITVELQPSNTQHHITFMKTSELPERLRAVPILESSTSDIH